MPKPNLAVSAFAAALGVIAIVGCSRSDKASPEAIQPVVAPAATTTAPAATAATAASEPTPEPAAPPPAAPARAHHISAVDAGAAGKTKNGVQHACGAGACSADMKKGGK